MRYVLLFLVIPFFLNAQTGRLYDIKQVSEIHIYINPDTLEFVIDNKINDVYFHSTFIFNDLNAKDTLTNVGFRLKGNTSLDNQKKSFKLSFNTFEKGRKFQGVKKLNLLANVNDPTMVRQMLYYYVYDRSGLIPRRGAFVNVFINDEYRGLYTNLEEPDDEWIEDHFESDKGNLYKCTYPADLVYLGSDQNAYKNIFNDGTTRAYDLKTNEDEDDYSDLIRMIELVNKPSSPDFVSKVQDLINIRTVLKSYAVDIATGNWDDYFYLKNNYYLYREPDTDQFHYAAYDTDNSFGIDWVGVDWGKRDALKWHHQNEPRPLISSLLKVPEFNQIFINYLDSITTYVTHPDTLFPVIDVWKTLITPHAAADVYRTLDYGYTMSDFHDSYIKELDGQVKYGLKPFLNQRRQRTIQQLTGLSTGKKKDPDSIKIYPNPAHGFVNIISSNKESIQFKGIKIYNNIGKVVLTISNGKLPYRLDISGINSGLYIIEIETPNGNKVNQLIIN